MAGILGDALQTARQFQGLASVEQQMQQQAKQAEQQKIGFEALKRYQETAQAGNPDNDAMTTALIYNPDAAKSVLAHVGIQDQRQKQDAASFVIKASMAESPEQMLNLTRARNAYLVNGNRDPAHTAQLEQMIASGDVQGAKGALKSVAAALVADGSLEKSAYELAYGKVPESMNEYQKATIELDKQRLGLEQQRLASGGQMTAGEREFAKYEELLKTDPERAKVFGRARGFLSTEGQKLSVFDSKVIDTASNEYSKLSSAASNYRMLAEKIKAANLTSGAMGTLQEYGKEMLGAQDLNTDLRKSVAQIVASEASKNLNPGSTTEREYAIAREPMPTGRGNSEQVARWLTAVANVSEHNAKFQEHKARFIGQYGGQRDPETGETVLSSWKKIQEEQAPANTGSSLDEKKKRLQELRAKQGG